MPKTVITIARGFGSGGRTVGKILAEKLNLDFYYNELLQLASEESGINIELFGKADEKAKSGLFKKYNRSYGEYVLSPNSADFVSSDNLFNYQAKIMKQLAEKGDCVIIGRCGNYILKDDPNVIKLYLYSDLETSLDRVTELYGMKPSEAKRTIDKIDKSRAAYYEYYTGKDWHDLSNYDLCVNTSGISFEKAAEIILAYIEQIKG